MIASLYGIFIICHKLSALSAEQVWVPPLYLGLSPESFPRLSLHPFSRFIDALKVIGVFLIRELAGSSHQMGGAILPHTARG
mgnify:CR=1 FL=1